MGWQRFCCRNWISVLCHSTNMLPWFIVTSTYGNSKSTTSRLLLFRGQNLNLLKHEQSRNLCGTSKNLFEIKLKCHCFSQLSTFSKCFPFLFFDGWTYFPSHISRPMGVLGLEISSYKFVYVCGRWLTMSVAWSPLVSEGGQFSAM